MSGQPAGEIILYQRDDGKPVLEVRLDDETVWLSQQQLADLFQTSRTNVVEHVRHIYDEGELDQSATCLDFRLVRAEGSREVTRSIPHYNLDLIISLGYRVKSGVATRFRIWATERLREYLVKGFTMDDEKLKDLGGGRYWRELLERIRDIRSSERVLYRQVLDLYATSIDYDPKAEVTVEFFKIVQNKLHYAAHGRTAAEVIGVRADATKPNMGLTSFDWLSHLDRLIVAMDAPVLSGAGSVSHKQAVAKAEGEYAKFRAQLDAGESDVEKKYLDSVKRAQRTIEEKKS